MKKIFSILAIAALVSCNNGGTGDEVKADTTAVSAPAPEATVTPAPDTAAMAKPDTAAAAK